MALPVLLDIGPAVHQGAGLARYAERLAATLIASCGDRVAVELFYNAHSNHQPPPSLAGVSAHAVAAGQLRWRLSALGSQIGRIPQRAVTRSLRAISAPTIPALYHATEHLLPHIPHRHPSVLTVHDLIFERFPQHHTRRNVAFLRFALPRFVSAADAIIAVSNHTRNDLVELYKVPPAKITVIHEGIDAHFRQRPQADVARVKQLYSPDRPWLLMVGTLEPRKNHATALRALQRLRAEGFPHRLLIVGGKGWLFEPIARQVEELQIQNDVIFTGYVPTDDLAALYSGAEAVLLPSLYEGFGFPVLEAMACGAPVICSNVSSLPEVAGDAALLVPPTDADAIADGLRRLLANPSLQERLRALGKAQAARFTWERCAQETAALYLETATRKAREVHP